MNEPEEKAEIRRCQAGDTEAFRILAERYEAVLYGIAYLMVLEKELAADMVQETLLKMWTQLPNLRNPGRLKSWLIRILVNTITDHGRKRHPAVIDSEVFSELPDGSEMINEKLERQEIREVVREALTRLPKEQRDTIVLRYFGDMKLSEIAFVTGCRKGTVKSRLNRALNSLESTLRFRLDVTER